MAPVAGTQAAGRDTGGGGAQVNRPVRAGLLLSRGPVAGWQRSMIMGLAHDPAIEIVLLAASPREKADDRAEQIRSLLNAIDRRFARKVLSRRFVRDGITPAMLDNSAADFPAATAFAHLRTVDIADPAKGVTEIIAADLDVIVDLDGGRSSSGLSEYTRHGQWTLSGEGAGYDAVTPLGFWEFYRNAPVCTIHLARMDGAGRGRLVASGTYSTHRWSWSLNAMLLARKAALLVADALKQLAGTGPRAPAYPAAQIAVPTAAVLRIQHVLMALFRVGWRVAGEILRRGVLEDRWRILLVPATPAGQPAAVPAAVIEPPAHSYWADPFVVRREGRGCIFFEEYLYAERRGVISYIDIAGYDDKRLNVSAAARRVLDAPYHLSYPFLFQTGGSLFMIPESSANRSIDLWVCTDFPARWKKLKSIMTGVSAVDTSVLFWDGRWWLFTNIDRSGLRDHCYELHVFHSEDPVDGTWVPHARNPVVVDARRARMGGGFLKAPDGRPIRCCQVQGKKYGEALTYQLIETLSPCDYHERPVDGMTRVEAQAGARHHHLAGADGLFVADECRETFKLERLVAARRRAERAQ